MRRLLLSVGCACAVHGQANWVGTFIRHLGQPNEIAEAAVLLASGGGSYITGQTLPIDGGSLLSSICKRFHLKEVYA